MELFISTQIAKYGCHSINVVNAGAFSIRPSVSKSYLIINMFVYSPSDTEHAVTAKLKRINAIYRVDVFTLITVCHWFTWPGDSE